MSARTVPIRFEVPVQVYRGLVRRCDKEGTNVKKLLLRHVLAAAAGVDPFQAWCESRDPEKVATERFFMPPEEMYRRIYDRETDRLLAYLREERQRTASAKGIAA